MSVVRGTRRRQDEKRKKESRDDRDAQEQGMDGEDGMERVCLHHFLISHFYFDFFLVYMQHLLLFIHLPFINLLIHIYIQIITPPILLCICFLLILYIMSCMLPLKSLNCISSSSLIRLCILLISSSSQYLS